MGSSKGDWQRASFFSLFAIRYSLFAIRYLPVHPARRLRLIVAERIEHIGLVQEAFDGRAHGDRERRRQKYRLPQLLVPFTNAHRKPLVSVENGVAQDELPLLAELVRARTQG